MGTGSKVFYAIGTFLALMAVFYILATSWIGEDAYLFGIEWIGSVGLVLAAVFSFMLAGYLNITERRLAQDGRAHIVVGGNGIDLRVATMPTKRPSCSAAQSAPPAFPKWLARARSSSTAAASSMPGGTTPRPIAAPCALAARKCAPAYTRAIPTSSTTCESRV